MRLFLVRHGEVGANRRFAYLGRRDDPLTPAGRAQAEALGRALTEFDLVAVYSSPLQRATDTAGPIAVATGLELREEVRLIEQSFGEWEGLTRREVMALGPESRERLLRWEADPGEAPPGGESFLSVRERVRELVAEMAETHPGRAVLVVSHVSPIKAILSLVWDTGPDPPAALPLFLDPATITVVDWGDHPVLRLFNSHAHLGWHHPRWHAPL